MRQGGESKRGKRHFVFGTMPKRGADLDLSGRGPKRLGSLKEEEEDNWKTTLFFWRGDLSLEQKTKRAKRRLVWRGTWVGSGEDELPTDEEFKTSQNTFELNGPADSGCLLTSPLQLHELDGFEVMRNSSMI